MIAFEIALDKSSEQELDKALAEFVEKMKKKCVKTKKDGYSPLLVPEQAKLDTVIGWINPLGDRSRLPDLTRKQSHPTSCATRLLLSW
tara:strand:+ start:242 stop:505 length:264 start_codon:yes stop_codon:yes gene_type:complete